MTDYAKVKKREDGKKAKLKKALNGNSYTPLRHDLINSAEFNNLSPPAKIVFFHLLGKYNGYNNGNLSLPQTAEQAKQMGMSDPTLKKGLKELLEKNFLELTQQGGKHQCALYALTCFSFDSITKNNKVIVWATNRPSDSWKKSKMDRAH